MRSILPFILLSALLALSCGGKQSGSGPSATATDSASLVKDPKRNGLIQMAEFEEIDSSGIVMFPIAAGGPDGEGDYGSYGRDRETPYGQKWNILFYDTKTGAYHLLSEQKMLIQNYLVGRTAEGQGALPPDCIFYEVRTDDYNGDGQLSREDPNYLFASDRTGRNFRQISPRGLALATWKYIPSSDRIIMTARQDSDGDKKFSVEDELIAYSAGVRTDSTAKRILPPEFINALKVRYARDWMGPEKKE